MGFEVSESGGQEVSESEGQGVSESVGLEVSESEGLEVSESDAKVSESGGEGVSESEGLGVSESDAEVSESDVGPVELLDASVVAPHPKIWDYTVMTLHCFSQPQGNSKNSGPKRAWPTTPSLERSLQKTLGKIMPLPAGVDDDP